MVAEASARDFVRGPMVVTLSDRWMPAEEPGPELLKAMLGKTTTMSLWKYNPGQRSPGDFLDELRSDLGLTEISKESFADPRFGRVNIGLYQRQGAFGELAFKIRYCDFVLDNEIYVLEMRAPAAEFDASDTEFRAVFSGLSNMSGGVPTAPDRRTSGLADERTRPALSANPEPPRPAPQNLVAGQPVIPNPSPYTFLYELADGTKLGFDAAQHTAQFIDASGAVKSTFPYSGTPYLSPAGVFILTGEYAYRLDPSNGNIISREATPKILGRTDFRTDGRTEVPATQNDEIAARPLVRPSESPGDNGIKSIIARAGEILQRAGVRPAIEFMMASRAQVEQTRSVHLYEFYFRLGELWEQTGDLETALAYYRLATKAID